MLCGVVGAAALVVGMRSRICCRLCSDSVRCGFCRSCMLMSCWYSRVCRNSSVIGSCVGACELSSARYV